MTGMTSDSRIDNKTASSRGMRWKPTELLEWAIEECGTATYSLSSSSVATVAKLTEIPGGPYELRITGDNQYGHPKLKEVLAGMYGVTTDRLLIAQGAAEVDFLVAGAALQSGGTAIVETPTYQPILRAAECFADNIVRLPRRLENGCQPDLNELRGMMDDSVRLICLTNLHNPSGVCMDHDMLRQISQIAGEWKAVVLVDEVFYPMYDWDYRRHSASCGCISVGSMDKTYGLSDLRAGWAVAPADIVKQAYSLNNLLGVHQPYVSEDLAAQILGDPKVMAWFRERTATAQSGRRLYDEFISAHSTAHCISPSAGINGLLSLPAGSDDRKFIEALKRQKDTMAFPGSLFELPGTIRVSFGGEHELIREGFKRLGELYREW